MTAQLRDGRSRRSPNGLAGLCLAEGTRFGVDKEAPVVYHLFASAES